MTASECQPKFRSRSHDAVIRVYDEAGNVIEAHAIYTRALDILDQEADNGT